MRKLLALTGVGLLVITACSAGVTGGPTSAPQPTPTATPAPAIDDGSPLQAMPARTPTPAPRSKVLDAGPSSLPEIDLGRFRQLLREDATMPVYDPVFVPARRADIPGDELVIGVEINGETKAYPITPLQYREMVNDELGGVPILVTW